MTEGQNAWWNTLRHEGVLISPIVLEDWLKAGPDLVEDRRVHQLRRAYYKFSGDADVRGFLDALLQDFLGHSKPNWRKEQNIPDRFKHQGKKPHRVLLNAGKEHQPRFLVVIDDRVVDDDGQPMRLGIHSGRKRYAELLRLMRAAEVPLGILTNGHHVRLVYAGLDYDSWAEWSVDAWFQGGEGRLALHGFYTLLGAKALGPDEESDENVLLSRIKESRDKQADLSHVMGTQVREAVERLLDSLTETLDGLSPEEQEELMAPLRSLGRSRDEELQAIYQAAIRCIMRLVVCLYAESRDLLPRSDRAYYESYSVEGLYQVLKQAVMDGHDEGLDSMRSAWPRLIALWRAIHDGSPHKDLQIPTYGGQLFRPPSEGADDTVLGALAVLQDPRVHVSDLDVYQILEKLRVGKYKIGRGKWRKGPVDFSDLRTEYIGMMYEGLLDYDLREAREDDGGIVFLAIGDQPALPLNILEAQSDADLRKLLAEQGKKKSQAPDVEEDDDETGEELDEIIEAEVEGDEEDDAEEDEDAGDADAEDPDRFEPRVQKWAERAIRLTRPKGGTFHGVSAKKLNDPDPAIEKPAVAMAARNLVLRAVPPGGMYLVRWSGTRKGSGTFYTKPGLAVPTTVRTLEPLVYENHEDRDKRVPKKPDEILSVKVCDPAMGSGSFLVAALRFMSTVLQESFETHVFPRIDDGETVTELGETARGLLTERILPVRGDGDERVAAALKRAVVEHCIHGVDLNPLAVELGKLSLWIETMDPSLRFTFLDHKIKCGNSLIGAWRHQALPHGKDQPAIYPLAAWDRQLGDGAQNPRTKRAKKIRKDVILPELKVWLDGYKVKDAQGKARKPKYDEPGEAQTRLFGGQAQQVQVVREGSQARLERVAAQTTLKVPEVDASWEDFREHELESLRRIHEESADPQAQEEDYRKLILESPAHQHQKYLLDKWCAAWFWPVQTDPDDPLDEEPVLGPAEFYANKQSPDVRKTVQAIAAKHRFLHWELEFPDVFGEDRFGFDAVVGNPPWETAKPQDNEFFTKYDPAYRTYGKQEGLRKQKALFEANRAILSEFWDYQEWYKAQSNYVRNCHDLGDSKPSGKAYQDKWLALTADTKVHPSGMVTPYAYQGGGDLNLYKLFIERFLASTHKIGRVGALLPAGLYSDHGTKSLREYLLDHNTWEWVYSFENRRKIFDIHASFKFACYIVQRGGRTEELRCRFMEHEQETWSAAEPPHVILLASRISELSPETRAVLELQDDQDVAVIDRVLQAGRRLQDIGFHYYREFNASIHADALQPAQGAIFQRDQKYGLVPVVSGGMVARFQAASGAWNGSGWKPSDDQSRLVPQHTMEATTFMAAKAKGSAAKGPKVIIRKTARATDRRTLISAIGPDIPCLDNASVVEVSGRTRPDWITMGILNSYVLDFLARFMVQGLDMPKHVLSVLPLPKRSELDQEIAAAAERRSRPNLAPADQAVFEEELDELVAHAFRLTDNDMRWILRPDNADPRNLWRDYRERLKVLEAAGHQGKWYTLEEARRMRKEAGMGVDF